MQNVFGVHRQQRSGAPEEHSEKIQRYGSQYNPVGKHEPETHDQIAKRHFFSDCHHVFPADQANQDEAEKRRGGVGGVNRRCPMRPGDERAADGRASD